MRHPLYLLTIFIIFMFFYFFFSGGKVLILIGMEFTHMSKDHKIGKNNNLDFVDNINVT